MKKRILSFMLVMVMMLSMVIIPTKAEAWTFDDLFEELDARNIGQTQFDVGAAETTGVVVDGKVDANDNYTVTKVVTYASVNGSNTVGAPDFTVSMARKGTDLYIAFVVAESEANSTKAKIQLGIGPSKGPTLSDAVVRTMTYLNADSTTSFNGTTYYGGPAGNDDANNPYLKYSAVHEYKKVWADGYATYECKLSIRDVVLQMTKTKTSGAWTKINAMQIMWFYMYNGSSNYCYYHNPGAAWNNAANPYKSKYTAQGFVDALKALHGHTYGATSTVIAHPIAFGGVEIDTGIGVQDPLGAVGTDVRNLAEGQVIDIATIAENAPELDGVIDDGEYTVTGKELEKAKKAEVSKGAPAIANLSYKDGYLYLGVTTDDKSLVNTQLDLNAMPFATFADQLLNRHSSGYNGGTDVINSGNVTSSMENGSNGWMDATLLKGMFDNTENFNFIVDAAAALNGEGNAVYEYKISVALLADFYCKAYDIDDGITYFGLQFWHAGNDGTFGSNDDQHGYRLAAHNAAKTLTAIDPAFWGLEWGLYTIAIPETVDSYQMEHKLIHSYESFGFETLGTGSARLSEEDGKSGLRFKTVLTDSSVEYLKEYARSKGKALVLGTIITPSAYLNAANGVFTKEALEALGKDIPYVDVKMNVDYPFEKADGNTVYAASIVNIKDINRDYAAIGYVQIGDEVIYSYTYAVRNIATIAQSALNDTSNVQKTGYEYEVAEGVWSPYKPVLYEVLKTLAPNNNQVKDPYKDDIWK